MSRSVRISLRTARALLSHLEGCAAPGFYAFEAELRAAMEPKRSLAPARKRRAEKKETKRDETARIREVVFARAGGKCEHCRRQFNELEPGELDHFFGRGRVKQSHRNTWALCRASHRLKTASLPSAKAWLEEFIGHAERHGYREEAGMATRRLGMVQARAELSRKEAAP